MSIDAVIERVRHTEEGLRLELAPRVDAEGQDSIAGQPALTIVGRREFTDPLVGMEFWGGSGTCILIERDALSGLVRSEREYQRVGYTRLREPRRCQCGERMYWVTITNTQTGQKREVYRCRECGAERPD
jgi:hypothetical protein